MEYHSVDGGKIEKAAISRMIRIPPKAAEKSCKLRYREVFDDIFFYIACYTGFCYEPVKTICVNRERHPHERRRLSSQAEKEIRLNGEDCLDKLRILSLRTEKITYTNCENYPHELGIYVSSY